VDEHEIHQHIQDLVEREHTLRDGAASAGDSADRRAELRSLEVQLDRCWDLLRQRQAKADARKDPNEASLRSADEVEGYRQ
jgi:hypothetical protein